MATAVRLLLFAVGCCIAFAVRPAASLVLRFCGLDTTAYCTILVVIRVGCLNDMKYFTNSISPSSVWHVQAYNVLGNVMSLVGGFASLSCSLLMPSLFYLVLFWKELARGSRTGAHL